MTRHRKKGEKVLTGTGSLVVKSILTIKAEKSDIPVVEIQNI